MTAPVCQLCTRYYGRIANGQHRRLLCSPFMGCAHSLMRWGGCGRWWHGAGVHNIVQPFVLTTSAGIHEKISDCTQLEAQLLRNSDLHLFRRSFGLFENCLKCTPLQIRKHKTRLFRCCRRLGYTLLLLFPFACCQLGVESNSTA